MAGRLLSRRGGQRRVRVARRRIRVALPRIRVGGDSDLSHSSHIACAFKLRSHPSQFVRHIRGIPRHGRAAPLPHCNVQFARRAAATEPCQRFAASSQPSGVAPAFKSGRAPTESGFLTSESTLAASALCKDSDMLRLLSTGSDITLNAES